MNAQSGAAAWHAGVGDALGHYAILFSFLALFIALSVASDHFLTRINLVNTLESGAIYGIVAVALTILLIVGEFDLCAGATYVLAGIVAAKCQPVVGTPGSLALGVVVGLVIGVCNGAVVAGFRLNSFVATLAMSLVVVGVGTKVTNGFQLYVSDPSFAVLGNATALGIADFVWIFFGFALACGLVLSRTKLGRWLYATGGNPEAARLSGIRTNAVRIGAFSLSGLAAGMAGVVLVSRTGTAIAGNGFGEVLFPAIAAVVVGGTSIQGGRGAVWRTVVGVFFLEFIRNGFNLIELDPYYQDIVRGGIILVAVAVDAISRRAA